MTILRSLRVGALVAGIAAFALPAGAQDIRRLLEERPDVVGLAVPGMPYGSPGMGPDSAREAYDVFLILRDGATDLFASYGAA